MDNAGALWYTVCIMAMFTIETREVKRLERDLKTFARRAYPFATKSTVNDAAFRTQKIAKKRIEREMVTRNRFTVQSVRVEQSRTLNVQRQAAIVGSTADYMADQEFGGMKTKKGKKGTPIPTSFSAGQGDAARPRTRLPRKPNKLANIQIKRRQRKARGRKQKNLVAVKQAASSSNKFIYLDLGRREGIFKVTGGKRNPRVKMVHDLSHKAVRIPRNPWLRPSVKDVQPLIPGMYAKNLRFQLKRAGVFRRR